MTPKEKCEELVRKYIPHVTYYDMADSEPVDYSHLAIPVAKKCALIAVDEIILSNPHSNPLNTNVYSTMDYWQKVKTEIEKI